MDPDFQVRPAVPPPGRTFGAREALSALGLALGAWILLPSLLLGVLPAGLINVLTQAGFALAPFLVLGAARIPVRPALGLRPFPLLAIPWIAASGLALAFAANEATAVVQPLLVRAGLGFEKELRELSVWVRTMPGPGMALLFVVAAPVGEETLYRGAVDRGLAASLGPRRALVLSALLFALIHLLPIRILSTFVLGLHFAFVARRTGSLFAAVLAHALNNAAALWLLPEREGPSWAVLLGAGAAYAALAWAAGRRGGANWLTVGGKPA